MIILFGGRFTAGKTTACRYFVNNPGIFGNFKEVNFADKLKEVAIDLFDMDPVKKDRTLLQQLGTEALRSIDTDVWAKYVFNRTIPKLDEEWENTPIFQKKSEYLNYVIGDGRYENELAYGKKAGSFNIFIDVKESIRMERYKSIYGVYPTEEQMNHDSEKIDPSKFDLTIENNDTIFVFQEVLDELYIKLLKWQKKK